MSDMLAYSTAMLSSVADFIGSPPIIYLFGLIFLAVSVRIIFKLIKF